MVRPTPRALCWTALSAAVLLTAANFASAQNASLSLAPAPASDNGIAEMKAMLEQQQKVILEMQQKLNALQTSQPSSVPGIPAAPETQPIAQQGPLPQNVRQVVADYLAELEQKRKDDEKAKSDEGYKVGTDLRLIGSWKNGVFFETPNKDFYMHIGGEMQWDTQWFRGDPNLYAAPAFSKGTLKFTNGANSGDPKGGIGELVDSTYFRRLRVIMDGGFWEIGEFMFQPKLEKVQNGQLALDEMWVGVKDIPILGTIRVGHLKTPQGLEGDSWSSNQVQTYTERTMMSNAFTQNFGTGLQIFNNIASDLIGQRATFATMFYRPQDGENGAEYADGDYATTSRISGLLIDQNEGRCLLHVAGSYTWRHNRNDNATITGASEIPDSNGGDNGYGTVTGVGGGNIGSPTNNLSNQNASVNGFLAGNGNPNGANATPIISTGSITASSTEVFGGELLFIDGPFSVQAEYMALTLMDTQNAGGKKHSTGDITFQGGYIGLNYTLTGENRAYDRRWGRLATNYFDVTTPFWLVKDENRSFNYGWGAWEIETRFSHLDLNSSGVNGGVSDALAFGLVWHLNNNLRIFGEFLHQDRYNTPVGVNSGWENAFAVRTQLRF